MNKTYQQLSSSLSVCTLQENLMFANKFFLNCDLRFGNPFEVDFSHCEACDLEEIG